MNERDPIDLLPLDDRPGPAHRIDEAHARALVERALDEVFQAAPAPRRRPKWLLAAAAMLVLAGTSVASASWIYRRMNPAPEVVPKRASKPPPPTLPTAPVEVSEVVAPATREPEPEPESTRAPKRSKRRAPRPADLLRQANRLRAERRYERAEETYLRVLGAGRTSDEAYVACVAAAGIRADQLGRPAGAIALYKRAMTRWPGGSLEAEILYGLAKAHRQQDDVALERSILERLTQQYPNSAYAAPARTRLKAITP